MMAGEVGAVAERTGLPGEAMPPSWVSEPYRLWSLLEIMAAIDREFIRDLVYFLDWGGTIKGARKALELVQLLPDLPEKKSENFPSNQSQALEVAERFEKHGLPQSAHLLRDWFRVGINREVLVPELQRRIEHELESVLWLLVPFETRKYYRANFGESVTSAFPSAIVDIEEAGNCFALGRFTACVFHLMRVMEVALRVLASTLKDSRLDPKRNPSWDSILKKCYEELAKERGRRAPEWAANDMFFAGVAARLMAVKDAWRNPTMHVEIDYDDEKALDVWNHVGAFMRHAATELREEPLVLYPEIAT